MHNVITMIPKKELEEMYCANNMSLTEIAHEVEVSKKTVFNWMKLYKIKSRTLSESKLNGLTKPSKKELEKMYRDKKMTLIEIANKIGVKHVTILNWMKLYNIKTRTCSESHLGDYAKISKEKLKEMYSIEKMSSTEIADKIGVSQTTILNWMKLYKIKSRTISKSKIGKFVGEKNGNWQGGTSFEPYCNKFNNLFKESIRQRDSYTCQLCWHKQKPNGRKLSVHHIHYEKSDCYPDCVALCQSCNARVNSNRDYWESYFENQLSERSMICWSILNA